ncbi:MAG: hybrid sensor histidine kinase/response regulator [Synechococcales cyanobacterium RU_4_20]|nr:hybrid sensor histidine kinase/response regulator [Synechococcales cyanobacterium RU_4_20]
MDQYSDLHLVAQEIIERVVQIQEVSSDIELALDETEGISRQLGRTAQQMQIGMTQVRMRPLAELTRRFPRQLRQLSLEHGKSVTLKEKGTGTLIERSILEALQDPLMHLLRNCFDHGIESPEMRQNLGKPVEGSIMITASYRGNQTVITVSDDGGGINLEKIKTKVVSGLGLTNEEISTFSEQEILDLIFEPGFSTAEAVTDLSGRGIGMDVVRKNIEAIQGTVQVETELGVGTTFTLVVPLSLSVTRVLVVECQGLFVALPASIVEEMTLLSPSQILTAADRELIEWQGYTVPLLRLEHWIRFNRPPIKLETESVPIIDQEGALIVTQGNAPYAIYCDRYWGEQEVTTRLVEGNISLPPGFSGCVVLGDGRIVPLMDTEALLSWILSQPVPPFGPAAQPVTSPPQHLSAETSNLKNSTWDSAERPTVMIIDDSINVRRFLAITLEKAGYRVEQAKDGLDALEKLREDNNIDAIVSDVEMPRMDGFRFLATIQTVETCKAIPVVMLGIAIAVIAIASPATIISSKSEKPPRPR